MPTDVPLKCQCGKVTGTALNLAPTTGTHARCACVDCRSFIRFLGRQDILGDDGATEIFQFTPAQLRISSGTEQIRCLRLSPKGLMRWYADCCKTPVGNTLHSSKFPFVGVTISFMNFTSHGNNPDQVLGPVLMTAFEHQATKPLPKNSSLKKFRTISRIIKFMGIGFLTGKAKPSPFFNANTGEPIVTPRVLSYEERQQLRD